MPVSQRKSIRQAVTALLKTPVPETAPPQYRTAARNRVYPSRTAPVKRESMPAIAVYTTKDRRDPDYPVTEDGPQKRRLTLIIQAFLHGETGDDQADDIEEEILAALGSASNLGGLVESLRWDGTELELVIIEDETGEDDFVAGVLTFEIVYYRVPAEDTLPAPPTTVYGAWAPNIGPDHIDDYQDITDGSVPDYVS